MCVDAAAHMAESGCNGGRGRGGEGGGGWRGGGIFEFRRRIYSEYIYWLVWYKNRVYHIWER